MEFLTAAPFGADPLTRCISIPVSWNPGDPLFPALPTLLRQARTRTLMNLMTEEADENLMS